MVAAADLILRVKAVEYSGPPVSARSRIEVGLLPETNVQFLVEEVVKGSYDKPNIILPGYLVETDEWNNGSPPYTSVRPSGGGSCFAISYRKGGQFLLMLRKWTVSFGGRPNADGFTVYWYPLGPINEQLRSSDDPWVQWVRDQVTAK
jgi:hypothetical protein